MLILKVIQSPEDSPAEPGTSYEVPEGKRKIIGRGSKAEMRVRYAKISRGHAELIPIDGWWYVKDLGSTNGTKVNNQYIKKPKLLKDGDQIKISKHVFEVTCVPVEGPVRPDADETVRVTTTEGISGPAHDVIPDAPLVETVRPARDQPMPEDLTIIERKKDAVEVESPDEFVRPQRPAAPSKAQSSAVEEDGDLISIDDDDAIDVPVAVPTQVKQGGADDGFGIDHEELETVRPDTPPEVAASSEDPSPTIEADQEFSLEIDDDQPEPIAVADELDEPIVVTDNLDEEDGREAIAVVDVLDDDDAIPLAEIDDEQPAADHEEPVLNQTVAQHDDGLDPEPALEYDELEADQPVAVMDEQQSSVDEIEPVIVAEGVDQFIDSAVVTDTPAPAEPQAVVTDMTDAEESDQDVSVTVSDAAMDEPSPQTIDVALDEPDDPAINVDVTDDNDSLLAVEPEPEPGVAIAEIDDHAPEAIAEIDESADVPAVADVETETPSPAAAVSESVIDQPAIFDMGMVANEPAVFDTIVAPVMASVRDTRAPLQPKPIAWAPTGAKCKSIHDTTVVAADTLVVREEPIELQAAIAMATDLAEGTTTTVAWVPETASQAVVEAVAVDEEQPLAHHTERALDDQTIIELPALEAPESTTATWSAEDTDYASISWRLESPALGLDALRLDDPSFEVHTPPIVNWIFTADEQPAVEGPIFVEDDYGAEGSFEPPQPYEAEPPSADAVDALLGMATLAPDPIAPPEPEAKDDSLEILADLPDSTAFDDEDAVIEEEDHDDDIDETDTDDDDDDLPPPDDDSPHDIAPGGGGAMAAVTEEVRHSPVTETRHPSSDDDDDDFLSDDIDHFVDDDDDIELKAPQHVVAEAPVETLADAALAVDPTSDEQLDQHYDDQVLEEFVRERNQRTSRNQFRVIASVGVIFLLGMTALMVVIINRSDLFGDPTKDGGNGKTPVVVDPQPVDPAPITPATPEPPQPTEAEKNRELLAKMLAEAKGDRNPDVLNILQSVNKQLGEETSSTPEPDRAKADAEIKKTLAEALAALRGEDPAGVTAPAPDSQTKDLLEAIRGELRHRESLPEPNQAVIDDLARANSVVFIVDASASLFETMPRVLHFLRKSIDQLKPTQKFKVVFFQQNMLIEVPSTGRLMPADDKTRHHVHAKLAQKGFIHPRGVGNPINAFNEAMLRRPDLIYLMSDAITSNRIGEVNHEQLLLRIEQMTQDRPVRISTVQFYAQDALDSMKVLAEKFGGAYTYITESSD